MNRVLNQNRFQTVLENCKPILTLTIASLFVIFSYDYLEAFNIRQVFSLKGYTKQLCYKGQSKIKAFSKIRTLLRTC